MKSTGRNPRESGEQRANLTRFRRNANATEMKAAVDGFNSAGLSRR
jgi:hypothetical protein